jgi:hypothetical protein
LLGAPSGFPESEDEIAEFLEHDSGGNEIATPDATRGGE